MTAIKKQIEALNPDIKHIRPPIKAKSDDWRETADQWLFTFSLGLTFDFYSGIGHRKSRSGHEKEFCRLKMSRLNDDGIEQLIKVSNPQKPKVDDLLYSLSFDSVAGEMSFKDWAAEFGMSSDSISALQMYMACQEAGTKLGKLGFSDLVALRNHFHGY